MTPQRTNLQAKRTPSRRPPVAVGSQRKPAAGHSVRPIQQRLGNQATQALLSRPPTTSIATATKSDPDAGRPIATASSTQSLVAVAQSKSKVEVKASSKPTLGPIPDSKARSHKEEKPASQKEEKLTAPVAQSAVAPVVSAIRQRAAQAKKHNSSSVTVASAQAAAIKPAIEQQRSAATQTVAALGEAKAEQVKRNEFKFKLRQAIEAATPKPKSESEAESVMKTGGANASQTLRGQLAVESEAATGGMSSAAANEVSPQSQPAPTTAQLQSEQVGPPPAPVSAAPVAPRSLPPERLDYSADRSPTNQVMADNGLSEQQFAEARDPAFAPAIMARSSANQHEAQAATVYRQGESKVQAQAQVGAAAALKNDLAGIHATRGGQLSSVAAKQMATKSKDELERQRITTTINSIKDKTRTDVAAILQSMETEVSSVFEASLQRAEKAYEKAFEEAKGGVGTWLTTWGDDWKKHIESALGTARSEYMRQVDVAIDEVANLVDTKLKAANQRVADGRAEVERFVEGLDASTKQFSEEAMQAVSADFDKLGSEIDSRQDSLIQSLTEQYKASYGRMAAMEKNLRDANKSLWERVYDATVGLAKQIIAFKDMLLGILGRAAAVIGDIIAHPIRFLGNLVKGVMLGLKNFTSKLGTYLQKGLMDWLFGALAGAGLQLPDKLDLKGIISIVLQIIGLTYANFRARAVKIVGEPAVKAIEKTAEVFKLLITEGVPGLWRLLVQQLADLKTMVIDAIFDFVKEKVIVAGITWIIGLLNPASAFFKACKALYDIVMFFVDRGRQIMELVNAVINSMASIAKGAIGTAAAFVENALAKSIPVAIGFLASLLGLGDPSKPVKGFIDKARAPVNKAIDWLINMAVKGVKTLFGKHEAKAKDEGQANDFSPIEETFTVNGKPHSIVAHKTEEPVLKSRPVGTSRIPELKELGAEYALLLKEEIERAKRGESTRGLRSERRKVIKAMVELIKSDPELQAMLMQGDKSLGHPPNIGEIRPHSSQSPKFRPVSGNPSFAKLWELESEHVIPRSHVDVYFGGLGAVTDSEYKSMHTIIIYRGAAGKKTHRPVVGDLNLLNTFRLVLEFLKDGVKTKEDLLRLKLEFEKVFESVIDGAISQTKSEIEVENKENGPKRGTASAAPSADKVKDAAKKQRQDVNKLYEQRIKDI